MRYSVTVTKTAEGYSVWVPGLPGCWSQGSTQEEALKNIKEAIEDFIHVMEELSTQKQARNAEIPA
jgi:predicted RNase H-like HicB family nuclease